MKGFGSINNQKKINNLVNLTKEQIVSLAIKYHSQGNISQATKYYKYCIENNINEERVFYNYGIILRSLNKFVTLSKHTLSQISNKNGISLFHPIPKLNQKLINKNQIINFLKKYPSCMQRPNFFMKKINYSWGNLIFVYNIIFIFNVK